MGSVLHVQARLGQRALLLTTAAVQLTGWTVHALALHRRLAAAKRDPLTRSGCCSSHTSTHTSLSSPVDSAAGDRASRKEHVGVHPRSVNTSRFGGTLSANMHSTLAHRPQYFSSPSSSSRTSRYLTGKPRSQAA